MVSTVANQTPCYSLLLAHSMPDSFLCGHLEAAPAMCLHVSHPADGLDLGVVGSPLVPVLVRSHLKHILEATVARVLVAHPAVRRRETDVNHKSHSVITSFSHFIVDFKPPIYIHFYSCY